MKNRSLWLVIVVAQFVLATTVFASAGGKPSVERPVDGTETHGGDAVKRGEKWALLDVVENHGEVIVIRSIADLDKFKIAARAIFCDGIGQRIDVCKDRVDDLFEEQVPKLSWILVDVPLENIKDEGQIITLSQDEIVQVAILKERQVVINKAIWLKMDSFSRAALVYHELMNYFSSNLGYNLKSSIGTAPIREIVNYMMQEGWREALSLMQSAMRKLPRPLLDNFPKRPASNQLLRDIKIGSSLVLKRPLIFGSLSIDETPALSFNKEVSDFSSSEFFPERISLGGCYIAVGDTEIRDSYETKLLWSSEMKDSVRNGLKVSPQRFVLRQINYPLEIKSSMYGENNRIKYLFEGKSSVQKKSFYLRLSCETRMAESYPQRILMLQSIGYYPPSYLLPALQDPYFLVNLAEVDFFTDDLFDFETGSNTKPVEW